LGARNWRKRKRKEEQGKEKKSILCRGGTTARPAPLSVCVSGVTLLRASCSPSLRFSVFLFRPLGPLGPLVAAHSNNNERRPVCLSLSLFLPSPKPLTVFRRAACVCVFVRVCPEDCLCACVRLPAARLVAPVPPWCCSESVCLSVCLSVCVRVCASSAGGGRSALSSQLTVRSSQLAAWPTRNSPTGNHDDHEQTNGQR